MFKFSEILRRELKYSHISQADLARYVGVHPSLITQWLNGDCEPSLTVLRRICVVMSISADEILKLEEISDIEAVERETVALFKLKQKKVRL